MLDNACFSFNTFSWKPCKWFCVHNCKQGMQKRLDKGGLPDSEGEDSFHHFIDEKSEGLETESLSQSEGQSLAGVAPCPETAHHSPTAPLLFQNPPEISIVLLIARWWTKRELGEKWNEEMTFLEARWFKKKKELFRSISRWSKARKKKIWGNDGGGGWDHLLLSPVKNVFLTFSFLQMSVHQWKMICYFFLKHIYREKNTLLASNQSYEMLVFTYWQETGFLLEIYLRTLSMRAWDLVSLVFLVYESSWAVVENWWIC